MLEYRLTLHQPHEGHELDLSWQNKNRFVLFFTVYATLVHGFNRVTLHFMVPGHTKTHVDGAFGLIKSCLKTHNAKYVLEIFQRIDGSADSNSTIAVEWVQLLDWKHLLCSLFKVSSGLKINSNYVYEASRENLGFLFAKQFSAFDQCAEHIVFQDEVDQVQVKNGNHLSPVADGDEKSKLHITPLSQVPSAK